MTFTPPSSIGAGGSGGVVTQGTVPWVVDGSAVTQPVSGPLTDAQLRAAALEVDGSAVTQPVSGPLTDAQLRAAAVEVDGSAVTQPVSAEDWPLPDGAATEATLSELLASDVGRSQLLVLLTAALTDADASDLVLA